jgi:drug/metabolite transporter (DMT)-like permease
MKKLLPNLNLKVVFAFAAVYLIWGTTYLAIKIGLEEMPPFLMAFFRYLIAGTVLLGICLVKQENIITKTIWKNMLLGAFLLLLGQGVLFWVEQYLSSGLTAVFIGSLPICYLLVDVNNWQKYFKSKLTLIGIVLGLIGIIVLFRDQSQPAHQGAVNMQIIASFVVLGSCFCWAIGSLYYNNKFPKGSLFCDIGWQLFGGALICLLVSLFADPLDTFTFAQVSLKTWGAVFYLAIAGSIVAFTSSYYLLSVRPAAVVGTYAYVNPVIAMILGYLIADERITISQIAGIVIILIAAYLSNTVKLQTKP